MRQTLADQLAERIHVIRIDGHNVSMGMGVKIPDGQSLHMAEQLRPDAFHGSLAYVYHNPVVSIGAQDTCCQHRPQRQKPCGQRPEIRRRLV